MPLELEPDLIERAKFGGAPLERLITAVWPEAYRIARGILRDPELAEDAAQEACASIARSLRTLKKSSGFRAWSYKLIVNHAISALRRRTQTQSLDALEDHAIHFDHTGALDLYHALGSLPPVQRAAIILHYYAGLNSAEIAVATGLPSSTVRFHLMLARKALRKALADVDATTQTTPDEVFLNVL